MTTSGLLTEHVHLSRRERQIMDVLYAGEELTAAEIQRTLPDSPSYSTVRALLKKLLDKGHVAYREVGPRYVYRPVLEKQAAAENAITRLVNVFFKGSAVDAVLGLLGREREALSEADLERLEETLVRLKTQESGRDDQGRETPSDD